MRFCLPLVASLALLTPVRASAQTQDSATSNDHPAAGTYTEEQAARGKSVYDAVCAACHTTSFHTDETFRFNWFGRTVLDLFKTLKTTMPEDNPGGLSDDDYARVIAYILKLNGFAPGIDSLPVDSVRMKSIRISGATSSGAAHPPIPPQ